MSGLEELRLLCTGDAQCTAPEHWEGCYAEVAYAVKYAELRARADKLIAERDAGHEPKRSITGLEELRRLEAAATEGPWVVAYGGDKDGSQKAVTSKETKSEFLALALHDDGAPLWLVSNDEVIPAVTGDGPKARQNAEFIVAARKQLPRMLAALDAVLALAEGWRYKGEFGWGAWQEGHGPDPEGYALDGASADLRAAITRELEGES